MYRLSFIIILIIFPIFLGKGQSGAENRQLFEKADKDLIIAPDKVEEITNYLFKDSSGKKLSKQVYNLKVKSLYYQGKYNEALELLVDESKGDHVESVISENILRSFLIFDERHKSNRLTDLELLNNKISYTYNQLKRKKTASTDKDISQLATDIKPENRFYVRENIFLLINEMFITNQKESSDLLFEKINSFCKLYSDDQMFQLLYIQNLISGNQIIEAETYWKNIKTEEIKTSPNLTLKLQYYTTLANFSFAKKEVDNYLNAKKEEDKLSIILKQKEAKARSYYLYLKQKTDQKDISDLKTNGRLALSGIIILGTIIFSILLARFLQIRSQIREYQTFLEKIKNFTEKKTIPQTISEKTENDLLIKLESFESTEYYLSPNISLQTLAKKLGTNTKYLSETINKHKEKNFNGYINDLRIHYIVNKLKNEPVYRNYKIGYLAEESGFATHSQFTVVFKSVSGMSPANFIKLLKEQK